MNLLELNWGLLAPELTIAIVAVILTFADLVMRKGDRKVFGWLSIIGIILSLYFVIQDLGQPAQELLEGSYRVDSFASLFKLIFLVGTLFVLVMSINYVEKKEIKHDGEFYYLFLTALLGAMFMASSADIITLYIGLELLSISSYIMAGIRKFNLKSNEAAYKYVIIGGVSSAIFLYGTSFIYGVTGSTNIFVIAERIQEAFNGGFDFYIYLGFFMMLVGLSYKISAVPSYMWSPDVYEGAATPVTAFLSVISKAAGFAIIIRLFITVFTPIVVEVVNNNPVFFFFNKMTLFLAVISGLTMIIGNTLALRQTNVKRMMAYSSVAQAGYLLVPLATMTMASEQLISVDIRNIIFYLMAYLFMNLGVFTVITIVNKDAGTEDLKSFAGLYHRSPFVAIAMTFFLMSLAGLPISAGFIGKFNIFISALTTKSYWLAGIMVATSVISYFYYFNIVRQMYMRPGHTEAKLSIPFSMQFVILLTFIGTFVIGLVPNVMLDFITKNFDLFNMLTLGQ
ncbi:NADH-quinone oxidoreductase subunit NuoN [Tepidibacillus infernus]|uniref:NADH-quinone oxidoreductase subunit N n=1 Tax=Tepidibacillus decaturensis TaxID=1413211 RepID=A0A135L6S9_9BACI|nr:MULTISPECIES: NADH-quinone oxidoreductase subunit NuoN [Tepidibacillus]KXG44639.1 NADH:ubiquinone oxidoreductase subunit N [Tepidibacillus decaturensis]GBF11829.1 NADH-quinone oxidoreductase subunit N [Tepidibacillus sp. HK-1]